MSKAYEFLKECGSFFVLTLNGDYPAGRPFGAVMEVGDYLYLSTNDMNNTHKQMREHNKIQIVAKKSDSREWIRITGIAIECDDKELKDKFTQVCSENFQNPSDVLRMCILEYIKQRGNTNPIISFESKNISYDILETEQE